jgi:uncharacterized protein
MKIEVVFAFPERAHHVRLELPAGATVREALQASGLEVNVQTHSVGVFGRRATLDQPLADGDRVEIYRPLAMDPKEARRLRARKKIR